MGWNREEIEMEEVREWERERALHMSVSIMLLKY